MKPDRYEAYAPISAEDGTRLLTCSECGAVIQQRTRQIHDEWHAKSQQSKHRKTTL